jgi:hypothetical protein
LQFDTIRLALIKVAARVTELKTRIKVALPTWYPHQQSWALLAGRARQAATLIRGAACPDPRRSLISRQPERR